RVHEARVAVGLVLHHVALRDGAVTAPELDVGAVGGAGAVDVDAFAARRADQADRAAAGVFDAEGLRRGAVAGVLLDVGAVGAAGGVDVEALAAAGARQRVGAAERDRVGADGERVAVVDAAGTTGGSE